MRKGRKRRAAAAAAARAARAALPAACPCCGARDLERARCDRCGAELILKPGSTTDWEARLRGELRRESDGGQALVLETGARFVVVTGEGTQLLSPPAEDALAVGAPAEVVGEPRLTFEEESGGLRDAARSCWLLHARVIAAGAERAALVDRALGIAPEEKPPSEETPPLSEETPLSEKPPPDGVRLERTGEAGARWASVSHRTSKDAASSAVVP
jgi:hypothetical protein